MPILCLILGYEYFHLHSGSLHMFYSIVRLYGLFFLQSEIPRASLNKPYKINIPVSPKCRSQWPRGLRHEPSSRARRLRSWVRIPLKTWMPVCVRLFCVCVVLCVGSGLATGWSPVQGVLTTVYRLRNWKSGQGLQGLLSHRCLQNGNFPFTARISYQTYITRQSLRWDTVSPLPQSKYQAAGQLLDGCPRLLIQYILSYPPYLEAVSSIRNLRTHHAVTSDTLSKDVKKHNLKDVWETHTAILNAKILCQLL
jgi:hypothetical protein